VNGPSVRGLLAAAYPAHPIRSPAMSACVKSQEFGQ
jgi:hypothetical protein